MIKIQKVLLYIIINTLFLSFFSCKPKQEEDKTTRINRLLNNDSIRQPIEIPEISSYLKVLQHSDIKNVKSLSYAMESFLNIFARSDSSVCDSAYVHFQQFADSIEFYQNLKLEEDTANYSIIFSGKKIPKKITEFVINLNQNGFRIQLSDSIPTVILNRKFIVEKFDSLISTQLKTYLLYLENEFKTGFAESDSIIISPIELVDRILWYENFIQNYPNFVFRRECENHLKAYTTYLVLGYGKTKFFQDESKFIISAYFKQSFEYLFNKNTNSTTANKLLEFKTAIESSSFNKLIEARKNLSIKGIIYNIKT